MPDLSSRLRKRPAVLTIPAQMVAAICSEGWRSWPLETGGVLLGVPTHSGAAIVAVIGPGPEAVHERTRFTPDTKWQADEVAAYWRADRSLCYLGDWHTHPNGAARFSKLDKEAAETIAQHRPARQPEPFMLVAALSHRAEGQFAAGQLKDGRLRHVVLTVTEDPASSSPSVRS